MLVETYHAFLRRIASQTTRPSDARQLEFLSGHISIFSMLAVPAFVALSAIMGLTISSALIAFLCFAAVVGAIVAHSFTLIGEYAVQHERDLIAAQVVDRVQHRHLAQPFAALLSPFDTAHLLADKQDARGADYGGTPRPMSFEPVLSEVVADAIGPLVSLGAPTPHDGAGRALIKAADWRDTVEGLAEQAELLVVAPTASDEGRELLGAIVRAGLLDRTIFVDRPTREMLDNGLSSDDIVRERAVLAAQFMRHGLSLPPHAGDGALLHYATPFMAPQMVSLKEVTKGELKAFLADTRAHPASKTTSAEAGVANDVTAAAPKGDAVKAA